MVAPTRSDIENGENSRHTEILTPLLDQHSTIHDEHSPIKSSINENRKGREQLWIVYLSTFVTLCGSLESAICLGYTSPIQSAITKELNLSTAEFSMFGSILTFGAMLGAITSGTIADLVGRKWAMRLSGIMSIAGWFAIYFATGAVALDIGRMATGCGMGVYSYVVPVYIAEISPKKIRGALTTFYMVSMAIGLLIVYGLGVVLDWRNLAFVGIGPCVMQMVGLFLIPESPRWLVKTGRSIEFKAAMRRLRGNDADISDEASEIQECAEASLLQKPKLTDLFRRKYMKSLTIGLGTMAFQQLGGVNGVCFYIASIFESVGFSSSIGSISYAVIQNIACALSATRMDSTGRKPLLLASTSGMLVGYLMLGSSFLLKAHNVSASWHGGLAVIGLLIFGGSFAGGMGPVPWVLMSEIFPINIKGAAGSLATLVNWSAAWAVSYTFNYLISWSSYGTFFLFAAVNVLAIVFIATMVPETKGKSLEESQADVNK